MITRSVYCFRNVFVVYLYRINVVLVLSVMLLRVVLVVSAFVLPPLALSFVSVVLSLLQAVLLLLWLLVLSAVWFVVGVDVVTNGGVAVVGVIVVGV